MCIRTNTNTTQAATSTQTKANTLLKSSTTDFQSLYHNKIQELWDNYQKTNLTAADQELQTIGGDKALEYKKELEKKENASQKQGPAETETIKKFMPDGSILIITTKNGKVVEQYRKKPKTVWVPDPLQTASTASNEAASSMKMKQVSRSHVFDD